MTDGVTTAFSISNAQGKRVEGEAPRSEYRKAAKEMADQLSTAEYTPTTEEVQDSFVLSHTRNYDSYMTGVPASDVRREYYEAFNRWRAVDHREVAVKTLREAADAETTEAARLMHERPDLLAGLGRERARMGDEAEARKQFAKRLRGEADRLERLEQSND